MVTVRRLSMYLFLAIKLETNPYKNNSEQYITVCDGVSMSVSAKRLGRRKIDRVSFTNSNQYGFLKRRAIPCSDNFLLREHSFKAFIIFLIP